MPIGNWVKIGGRTWNVRVTEITEDFSVLYSDNTGRTMEAGAPLTLDPLGTFFGHKVTFARAKSGADEFDALFNFLAQPRNKGIPIQIVHNQSTISYNAYVSSGNRQLQQIDEKKNVVKWDKLQVSFIAISAQIRPTG